MFLRSADDAAVAADFDEVKRKLKGGSRNNIKLRVYIYEAECKEQYSNHSQSTTIGSPFEWTTLHANNYDLEAQKKIIRVHCT